MNTVVEKTDIDQLFKTQHDRQNLQALKNTSARERISKIKKIESYILNTENHKKIANALAKDLRKSNAEVISTEITPVILTIKSVCKNLRRWMLDEHVPSPLTMAGMSSYIKYEPKGHVLIITPWNYPFQMPVNPLIYAIAAGNAITIKPSEMSANTSGILKEMINELFNENEIAVVEGDASTSTELLNKPFNHIHFTGSPTVGKIVMKAASQHLTSVTLELGGKSPVIVDNTVNEKSAAQKIAWAKCLNSGQTCIAPDYALVHKSKLHSFLDAFEATINKFYNPENNGIQGSPDYCRIINEKNHQRVMRLIDNALENGAKKVIGGESDSNDKYIPPTVLINVNSEMEIMNEEIFGPVLPVITYNDINEVIDKIHQLPTPLALYIMSNSTKNIDYIMNNTSAGGTAINELMMTSVNPNLPFGGKNNSGIGKSNGKHGFVDFSNERGVVKRKWGNLKIIYPPYSARIFELFKKVVRL